MTEVQWTATIRFGELTPSSASLGWATAPSTVRIHENRASTPASANTSTGSTTIRTSSQFPSQRRQQPLQQLPQLQLQQQRLVPRQLRPQRLHRRLLLQQLEAQDSIVCKLFFPKCSLLITGHETSSSPACNYTNEYVILTTPIEGSRTECTPIPTVTVPQHSINVQTTIPTNT